MGIFRKIFGSYSDRQIKKLKKVADAIEALAPKYAAMSNEELAGVTIVLKNRLQNGETLDDILCDAFAAVREADDRVLGKRPFYVQLLGGIILHQGRIAEMKTGEGKTLVATMPAYLNALTGEGVHVVTVNDYLARRDSEEMGRVYAFMGLSTGLIVHGLTPAEKQAAYAADITYGTNNEFGFDYLRDNMVVYKKDMVQRKHVFAIVDEVDSILIDEARTPLIISGAGQKSTDLYDRTNELVRRMTKLVRKEVDNKEETDGVEVDYLVDEKDRNAILTPQGAKKAEEFFGIDNLNDPENSTFAHHVKQAIHAHGVMKRDVDYVVNENGVMIVDSFTGRIMPGRRYSNGLHQAIEAKEGVQIQKENRTLATITFQNYFRMYQKLSGMTGTALTEETEFREIYALDVVEVPTNKPMIRIDQNDVVYRDMKGKYDAIVAQIEACYRKGQPVLVGTVSVDKSEELSARLKKHGIPHNVLNAKHHEREAEIVAQAGKYGAVTISTNMAGRGTDIMLGGNPEHMAKNEMRKMDYPEEIIAMATGTADIEDEEIRAARLKFQELNQHFKALIAPEAERVREAGGLFILGTERHESRRIDNQLRGRSGRQGDPGESRFFLSLDDDLMRIFGHNTERLKNLVTRLGLPEDQPISAGILSGSIERAQRQIEENHFKRRKYVLTYDDVMNQQRNLIYTQRLEVLNGEDISETVRGMMRASIEETVASFAADEDFHLWNLEGLEKYYSGYLLHSGDLDPEQIAEEKWKSKDLVAFIFDKALAIYDSKEELFGADVFREVERSILLQTVDRHWMEHIDIMDDLKGSIGLQAYAQRDPVNEYRLQGSEIFEEMVAEIRSETVRVLLSAVPRTQTAQRVQVAKPLKEGLAGEAGQQKKTTIIVRKAEKVGRNDLCPCGSGKKYKKCCGAPANGGSN
ncbi:MAG: preprotein translocase subunit SecA [Ruminococcaceae bacterium]|nr:preprotein translocase subunit SecA [Oscillospiraceae bacterium]